MCLVSKLLPCLVVLASTFAPAQIPGGHAVIAEVARAPSAGSRFPGGVYVVHPRIGAIQPITNLPPELIGSALPPSYGSGSNAVAVRSTDGALLVGERVFLGESVDLHIIRLNGLAVASDTLIPLGTATADADRVEGIAVLPSGDAIVVTFIGGVGAMVRVSTTGVVTPIYTSGYLGPVAVDSRGTTVFFVTGTGIEALPVGGGQSTLVHADTSISDLQFLPPAALMFIRRGAVYLFDLATLVATNVHSESCLGCLSTCVVERTTGALVYTNAPIGLGNGTMGWAFPGGTFQRLGAVNATRDITLVDSPSTYGTATPAAHTYYWLTAFNPGGLPRIGNGSFGLQLGVQPPGTAAGMLVLGLTPGDVQLFGVRILLDPANLIPLLPVPPNGTLLLPIPAEPSLVEQSLFFQSFHLDAGGLAASDGLKVTFML